MSRAIVLGGGGPVGVAWEAGLLEGLQSVGLDLAAADTVIGTSAGSVVGCILTSGGDLTQIKALATVAIQASEDADHPSTAPDPALAAAGHALEQLTAALIEAASDPAKADEARVRMGRVARDAETMSESRWLEQFRFFAGIDWPAGFCCTAVDIEDGSFRLWDGEAGVDAQSAVASSCAIPGVFPPVTIAGHRWMDGGVRDWLNADAATGHDLVLIVSCSLLDVPETSAIAGLEPVVAASRRYIDELSRAGARVEIVVPGHEMLELSAWGLNMMDITLGEPAYEAGLRQGQTEAAQLVSFWTGPLARS